MKVEIVKNNTPIAVSGHVGLGQRITAAITAELAHIPADAVRAGSSIRLALWKELEPEFKARTWGQFR